MDQAQRKHAGNVRREHPSPEADRRESRLHQQTSLEVDPTAFGTDGDEHPGFGAEITASRRHPRQPIVDVREQASLGLRQFVPVSYTHLTLPTSDLA